MAGRCLEADDGLWRWARPHASHERFQLRVATHITRRSDLVEEQRLFRMTNRVVKIDIVSQAAIHIPNKGQKRSETDSACDPDLFESSGLVIEHPVRALDDRVRAFR